MSETTGTAKGTAARDEDSVWKIKIMGPKI
jgi:hypothetical protein